jgi:hypothetical protein
MTRLICPTGSCDENLSTPRAKNIPLVPSGKSTPLLSAIPRSHEGRIAIVTDVGRGTRWTLQRHETNDVATDGEVVWS